MAVHITGTMGLPSGAVYPNCSMYFERKVGVVSQSGYAVVPEKTIVKSNAAALVDFYLLYGEYIGTIQTTLGVVKFAFSVLDVASATFTSCIGDVSVPIPASSVADAQAAAEIAAAAAESMTAVMDFVPVAAEPIWTSSRMKFVTSGGQWMAKRVNLMVVGGQSNRVRNSIAPGTGESQGNVFAWTGSTWVTATPALVGDISYVEAHRVSLVEARPAFIVQGAVAGTTIARWIPGGDLFDALKASALAAMANLASRGYQINRKVYDFSQGEGEYDLAPLYSLSTSRYPALINGVRGANYLGSGCQIIFTELLRQSSLGTTDRVNREWRRLISDGYTGVHLVSSDGMATEDPTDGSVQVVHFDPAGRLEMGIRCADIQLGVSNGVTSGDVAGRITATGERVWKERPYTWLGVINIGPGNVNAQVLNLLTSVTGTPILWEVDGVTTEVVSGASASVLTYTGAASASIKVWGPTDANYDQAMGFSSVATPGQGAIRSFILNPTARLASLYISGHGQLQHSVDPSVWGDRMATFRLDAAPLVSFASFVAAEMPKSLATLTFTSTTPVPIDTRAAITSENSSRGNTITVTFGTNYGPGYGPDDARILTPKMFGAVGDGAADDTAAIVAWAAAFDAARAIGPAVAAAGPGSYLMTGPVEFIEPAAVGNYRSFLDMSGGRFICNYNRTSFADKFITFGDAANPTAYNSGLDIGGGAWYVESGPAATSPPVGVYLVGFAQSQFDDVQFDGWSGTCLEIHGVQNGFFNRLISYGGGRSFGYSDTSGSQFRQTGSNLDVVSGAYTWPTTCVGKTIYLANSSGTIQRKCRILTRVSATQVTVGQSTRTLGAWVHTSTTFTDAVDMRVIYGGPAVTTTAASAVVTLDGPVTADMVGLFVGIPGAGNSDGKILWADVVSVNTGASQLTLSKNAALSLNPVANPLTETTEIATPAVVLRSDVGGAYTNGISQVFASEWQIETYRGIGIGVDDAELFDLNKTKIHGSSGANRNWSTYSLAPIWGNRVQGFWQISFDQTHLGAYRMRLYDASAPLTVTGLRMRTVEGEKLAYIGKPLSGVNGPAAVFGDISFIGADTAWTFPKFVDAEGTLQSYVPPRSMNRNNLSDGEFWLGAGAKVNTAGEMVVKSLTYSGGPTTFTPVVADASTGGNVAATGGANAIYERVGNTVFVSLRIVGINTTGLTAGNNLYIRDLPIPVRSAGFCIGTASARFNNVAFTSPPVAFADNGDQHIIFYQNVSGAAATILTVAALTSGTAEIFLSFSYPA